MPEDKLQQTQQNQQTQQQPQQGGEAVGMSRTFPENSSLEVLNNRRIDQIVAKREADRMKEAQAIKFAQQDGISTGMNQGIDVGRREGYDLGTYHGLEFGYNKGLGQMSNQSPEHGLGKPLMSQPREPESVGSEEDAIAQESVV